MVALLLAASGCTTVGTPPSTGAKPAGFDQIPNYGKVVSAFHPSLGAHQSAPMVVMLGGSEGGIWPSDAREIKDLRSAGFHVLTMAYFGAPGVPETLDRIRVESVIEAIEKQRQQPKVLKDCIGMLGVSKGGELTMLVSSLYPAIRAAVPIVPADVAFQAAEATTAQHSSWTWKNQEVPFVPYTLWSGAGLKAAFSAVTGIGEAFFDLHQQALQKNPEAVAAARFAVERINGPVLFISGNKDQYWPSSMMAERANQRLTAMQFAHPHQHLVYDTDHYVLDYKGTPTNTGSPALAPWPAAQQFFQTHIAQRPGCKAR